MRWFDEFEDIRVINDWLVEHGREPLAAEDIPDMGIIDPGVAVGFLVFTKPKVCFLECFVTNKKVPLKRRYKSIYIIARRLMNTANSLGFKRCMLISQKRSLVRIGKRLGFESSPAVTMGINL